MRGLGWIPEGNLKPFAETVAAFAGYGFDEWDWDAIFYGVKDTNDEEDRWYEYEFEGESTVGLRLARDAESDIVFVKIEASQDIETKAATTIIIMQSCRLSGFA